MIISLGESELRFKISPTFHEKLRLNDQLVKDRSVGERLYETFQHACNYQVISRNKRIIIAVCGSLFAAAEGREEIFRFDLASRTIAS